MKNYLLFLFLLLNVGISVYASPAYPNPVRVQQPDGTYLTIVGHGDEYFNYITTEDGYTVVKDEDNFYHYAELAGGELIPSAIVAHEEGKRTIAETLFLQKHEKAITPVRKKTQVRLAPLAMERQTGVEYTDDEPLLTKMRVLSGIDKKSYHGLIVLVNYNDRKFLRGDETTKKIFETMTNGRNVTSYDDPLLGKQTVTGSMHDFFYDNTNGQFVPEFDIIGPVTIDKSQYFPEGTKYSLQLAQTVVDAIDGIVDFSKYDSDKDGVVDFIYIIYAGYDSAEIGNDKRLLWAEANYMYNNKKEKGAFIRDGVKLGRYACSTELYGWQEHNDRNIASIGTMCHEFSHILGFADHYDLNGHEEPRKWDLMSTGSYNHKPGEIDGTTPAGYNTYERLSGGFMTPQTLTTEDDGKTITLPALGTEAKACRINTKATPNEYFLLENRQKTKWDAGLPGTGMLVWRVDSTDTSLWITGWDESKVNTTDHLCMQLVRAGGWTSKTLDSQADAYPGKNQVTVLSNTTSPANLLSYTKAKSPVTVKNITETDGVVTFEVVKEDLGTSIQTVSQKSVSRKEDTDCYNILGQRVFSDSHGLLIKGGKKVLTTILRYDSE